MWNPLNGCHTLCTEKNGPNCRVNPCYFQANTALWQVVTSRHSSDASHEVRLGATEQQMVPEGQTMEGTHA
jgi:hypothetical protein